MHKLLSGVNIQSLKVQVIVTFLGAFLGFIFALLVNFIFNYSINKSKKKIILKSIYDELKEIRDELALYDNLPPYFKYNYCIWETINSSGELLSLIGMKQSKTLIEIYARIIFADKFDQEYFRIYTSTRSREGDNILKKISEERRKRKDLIVNDITELLNHN